MRPIDALTDIDEKLIKSYISIYGGAECGPLSIVLQEWNKNKTKLFKAFGQKLIVSKWINIPRDEITIWSELNNLYHPYIILYDTDIQNLSKKFLDSITHNNFLSDVILFWVNQNYVIQDLNILSRLFMHRNLSKGYIDISECEEPYHFISFTGVSIKNGMKTIRTIQKILKATRYPHMELFEEWRNNVSLVQTHCENKAKLVLSIHPIDFMSMSDNKCNWRSCMSWQHSGCYNVGTLEMMNSNVAVVAYLESDSPFELFLNESDICRVPNKTWRSLVFVHKDILLCGKQYPYHNDVLAIAVLDFIRELVQKNLNWSYQFINQEYNDLKHIDGNFYLRDWFNVEYNTKKEHHCIFVYTHGMYNDIIESHSPHYLCCRNYVKKSKKICLSGPATCICCGRRLYKGWDICSCDDVGSDKICWDCHQNTCKICGKIVYKPTKVLGHVFCDNQCIEDAIYFPELDWITSKESMQFKEGSLVVGFFDEKEFNKEHNNILLDLSFQFEKLENREQIIKWLQYTKKHYPWIRFYKLPVKVWIRQLNTIENVLSQKTGCCLWFYGTFSKDIIQQEKIIQKYQHWILLKEYMEGGEYENNSTLTS